MANDDKAQRAAPPTTSTTDDRDRQIAAMIGANAQLERELDASRAALAAAEGEIARLRAKLGEEQKSVLPPLPKDALELGASVTIPVFDDKGQETRGELRPGDVVTTGDHLKLQRELGKLARVFKVTGGAVQELQARGFTR